MKECGDIFYTELSRGNLEEVAEIIASLIPRYLSKDVENRYFRLWEEHGFHLTPVDYYSPIPDSRELTDDLWKKESGLPGIDLNLPLQLKLLQNVFPRFREEYDQFPWGATAETSEFYFDNPMFSGVDALVLYCMIRHFRPSLIIEVGSGYSTRVLSKAVLRNGNGQIICVEPYPDDIISKLPAVTKVIPDRVQNVSLDLFQQLKDRDILFIDSSHTVKCGGDVNYLLLEVLPRLKKGVIVHFHDIFFPEEFPKDWVLGLHRFWSEQYLLQAFLAFNSQFEILFLNSYMGLKYLEETKIVFSKSPWWRGGSCWIRRKSKSSTNP